MSRDHELGNMEAKDENNQLLNNNNESGRNSSADELRKAVLSKDAAKLRQVIERTEQKELDLDHIYIIPKRGKRALLHCAAEDKCEEVAAVLLDNGASPDVKSTEGYTALHYAAEAGSPKVLRVLLDKGANVNLKNNMERTSLHVLALKREGSNSDWDSSLDELLRVHNIRIDTKDVRQVTPLYLAALKGWGYMVEKLLYKGARRDAKSGSKTAEEIINEKLPGLLASINETKIEALKTYYDEDLFEALSKKDLTRFKEVMKEINAQQKSSKESYIEQHHGRGCTLLSHACQEGLHEFVEVLLKEGANPYKADKDNSELTPLLHTARRGNDKIMKLLTEAMDSIEICLNAPDAKGETPLHKVVKRELSQDLKGVNYSNCFEILLGFKDKLKVNVQDKNKNTPLHYATLCNDQSFVFRLFKSGAHLNVKNIFGVLAISRIQPATLEEILDHCIESKYPIANDDFEIILNYTLFAPTTSDHTKETDCLKFFSGSKSHTHLLRHPVINTFLFLKWQRISIYYYVNVFLYAIFLLLLTCYITLCYGTIPKSFLWNNSTREEFSLKKSGSVDTVKVILQVLIMVFWICGVLRELVQCLLSCKRYFIRPKNWLEIFILILTPVLLFIPIPYAYRQGLSAWLILLSWGEMLLLLGRHPLLAVYIAMFTKVTANFLKFILMFSCVIISFSLSFLLLFQFNDDFATYPKSLLKTIAMSTGELEYTELPLSVFPGFSHLLFVVFVFIVVLVLMNLLNGLAVSDIQQIQQEAEILSFQSRIELIAYIESAFPSNPNEKQFSQGTDECGCQPSKTRLLRPLLHFSKYLGNKVFMFRQCLKDSPYIRMLPNEKESTKRWHICSCHKDHLQQSQIEAAKSIVIARRGGVVGRLASLENKVASMITAIESMSDIIQRKGITISPAE